MPDKGIIFSAPMVRSLIDGRKKVHCDNIDRPVTRCSHGESLEGGRCDHCQNEELEAVE